MALAVETHLDFAEKITVCFRRGKEYSHVVSTSVFDRCVSLTDSLDYYDNINDHIESEDNDLDSSVSQGLLYAPVIQSDLKFAAYGSKFIKNYLGNISTYVKRMNQALNDDSEDTTKCEKFKGFLAKVDVVHITFMYGLLDVYSALAKAQHGVSKVNQLPWHYNQRIDHLIEELEEIEKDTHKGKLLKVNPKLQQAMFEDDTPICTEFRRVTRYYESFDDNIQSRMNKGKT